MRRLRPALLLSLLVGGLLLPAGARAAAPSVVGFDTLPAGTPLLDQYNTPGTQVQFGHPNRFVDGALDVDPCPSEDNVGSMSVADGGISGRSAELGCRRDEIVSLYLGAFHTDVERRGVSFKLRGQGLGAGTTVRVQLFGVGDVLLEQTEVAVPDGQVVTFARARPQPDIVTVVLRSAGNPFSTLVLDDISMPLDDVPPPPKFELGLGKPGVDIVEGSTLDVPVNLLRYNGSAGAITFAVDTPPPGIVAAQATPNPVTGTNGPKLRITAASPFTGVRQLSVTASGNPAAGTFVGGGRTQTVTGVPALVLADGVAVAGAQEGVVRGCGESTASIPVGVRGGFSGPVDLIASTLSGPVALRGSFKRLNAAGNGTLTFDYGLVQAATAAGESTVRLRFRPEGATEVSRTVRVIDSAVALTDAPGGVFPPEIVPGARFGRDRRDEITLRGTFPSNCFPTFKDDRGKVLPVRARRSGVPDYGDDVRLQLPAPVLSTRVHVIGADNVELATSPRIEAFGFRHDPALSVANSGANAGDHDFTWSDFLKAFGSDDGDACSPFECHRDPFALQAFDNIRDKLRTDPGLCFGYATMAIQFEDQLVSTRDYGGTGTAWQLPFSQGSAIKDDVVRWQVSQYDSDWQDYTSDLKDDIPSPAAFIARLRQLLVDKDEVYVTLRQGTAGHAVVAYDLVDKGNGAYDILTYNPNTPYVTGEEGSDGSLLAVNAARSTITVGPGSRWSGGIFATAGTANGPWTGDMSTIEVIDRLPPSGADLSSTFWTTSLESAEGAAQVSQIAVGGVKGLRADGTSVPGTGIGTRTALTGVAADSDYTFAPGKSYAMTITGTRDGTYGGGFAGSTAGARVEGVRTRKGQADRVTLTPGRAALGLVAGASTPATIKLLDRVGKRAVRSAEVTLSSRRGAGDRLALHGGGLDLRHAGAATTVTATLGSVGEGAPASVTTRGVRVGPDQRLTLVPVSWSDIGAGVRYTIRSASGKVLRRGRVALRAPRAVALGAVRVTLSRKGGRVRAVLNGRVTRTGAAPLLVADVQVVRGGRTLTRARRALRGTAKVKTGRFSLGVPVTSVPPGARVQATVTLADEAAGFAAARRVVRTR